MTKLAILLAAFAAAVLSAQPPSGGYLEVEPNGVYRSASYGGALPSHPTQSARGRISGHDADVWVIPLEFAVAWPLIEGYVSLSVRLEEPVPVRLDAWTAHRHKSGGLPALAYLGSWYGVGSVALPREFGVAVWVFRRPELVVRLSTQSRGQALVGYTLVHN